MRLTKSDGDHDKVKSLDIYFGEVDRVLTRAELVESLADYRDDREQRSKDGVLKYRPLEGVNEVRLGSTAGNEERGRIIKRKGERGRDT